MTSLKSVMIALLLLFAKDSFGQEGNKMDCTILRNGKFKYLNFDQDTSAYVVINNENHIEWVNDCEYNMTMTKITLPNFPYHPGDIMNVKVYKIEDGIIYYTSTVKGVSWKGKFKIIK
jgi:hypothetical protein